MAGTGKTTDRSETSRQSEGQFRLAFNHAPIGIAIVGKDYRLLRVNSALCKALGYSRRELLERTFMDITHPDDVKKDKALAEKLFRGEIPSYRLEKRFITKDGRLVWLDLTALVIRDRQNEPLYGLAMVKDITQRKQSEEALRTSEERYRSFVVNSSEGIWRLEMECPIDTGLTTDEQVEMFQKYVYLAECNDAMARMRDYDRADDLIGLRFDDQRVIKDQTNLASVRTFITNGYRLRNVESVAVGRDGRKLYFMNNLIGTVVNGYLLRAWGTQRDETERKLAEEQIKSSRQQMRSLAARLQSIREKERTDIAREMHDQVGQGLAGLKIDISRLTKMLPESEDEGVRGAMMDRLKDVNRLLEETIAGVKNLSTELRPGVLDKFGLSAAVEWQCQEFERRTGIKYQFRLPPEEPSLSVERSTALFRILQEALTNVACHSRAAKIIVELKVSDRDVTLTLQDDGRGITVAEISAPTSLGLLGMRERAEMLGGSFDIKGDQGWGTVVNVSIPLNDSRSLDDAKTR
ncbi:MAG: PAS domain S-box protein [Pyrinomonadaceae bacterium]